MEGLEDAHRAGKPRAISVSNFLEDGLESLTEGCGIRPLGNQIPARLRIRYVLELGTAALPGAQSPEHRRENLNVDFESSEEDWKTLGASPLRSPAGNAARSRYSAGSGRKDASWEDRREEERLRGVRPGICAPQR